MIVIIIRRGAVIAPKDVFLKNDNTINFIICIMGIG